MKNIGLTILIATSIIACKSKKKKTKSIVCILEEQDCPALTPLDSAVAHIEAYADAWNKIPIAYGLDATDEKVKEDSVNATMNVYPTFAHAISVDDVIAAFGLKVQDGKITHTTDYIRAYVGLEGELKRQHLYFTPIGQNGEDSLLSCGSNQYVMELTTPCPNTCGTDSPLFRAFDDKLSPKRKAGNIFPITPTLPVLPERCHVNE